MTKLQQVFWIGFLLRFLVPTLIPTVVDLLNSIPEIVTPINSFKGLNEAFFYLKHDISLYDGSINTNPPLYLAVMKIINLLPFSSIWFNLIWTLIDLGIAFRLVQINKWYSLRKRHGEILKDGNPTGVESDTAKLVGVSEEIKSSFNKQDSEKISKENSVDSSLVSDTTTIKSEDEHSSFVLFSFSDDVIAAFYLFNPLIVLTTISHSSLPFTWLFIIESLSQIVLYSNYERSVIFLAIAAYLSLSPIYLLIPILALAHSLKLAKPSKIYCIGGGFFFMALGLLMFASFAITASWQFFVTCYGTIFMFNKISPNIGLWWYLFTEMFSFFTSFYVGIFNLFQFIFIIPLSVRLFEYKQNSIDDIPVTRLVMDKNGSLLAVDKDGTTTEVTIGDKDDRKSSIKKESVSDSSLLESKLKSTHNGDSLLAFVLCYLWISFTKSYPTIGDLGFGLSLIPIFKLTVLPHCRYFLLSGLLMIVCLLLSPIFYYCWIVLGNGNSNFFYSINLTWGILHALIIIDLFWGQLTLDYMGQHGLKQKIRLTQI